MQRDKNAIPAQSSEENAKTITVMKDILSSNNEQASAIRKQIERLGIRSFNLMSSPGSGKTTLLERTLDHIPSSQIAVIEGDLETENDANRIRTKGAQAQQITTGTTCHLDAFMIQKALPLLELAEIKYLFVENVGNLVCPANFDVGMQKNVILLSATEGDDKPVKYPVMFHKADLVLITKSEIAEFMEFDIDLAKQNIHKVNPEVPIHVLNKNGPDEFDKWLDYLRHA